MKSFDELTLEQQSNALKFARDKLVEAMGFNLVVAEAELTKKEIEYLIVAAAEGSDYDDDGKPVVENINVPFHFQGGCV